MKLYIKRIAQAALITSAVAVAGSAFAMASSNVSEGSGYTCPSTFNQVYLTTDGKPYWWVFAQSTAKDDNEHIVDSTAPGGQDPQMLDQINTEAKLSTLIPSVSDDRKSNEPQAGLELCPNDGLLNPLCNAGQCQAVWKTCSNILELNNFDHYRVSTTENIVKLSNMSKILQVNLTYYNKTKEQVIGFTNIYGSLNAVRIDEHGNLIPDVQDSQKLSHLEQVDLPVIGKNDPILVLVDANDKESLVRDDDVTYTNRAIDYINVHQGEYKTPQEAARYAGKQRFFKNNDITIKIPQIIKHTGKTTVTCNPSYSTNHPSNAPYESENFGHSLLLKLQPKYPDNGTGQGTPTYTADVNYTCSTI